MTRSLIAGWLCACCLTVGAEPVTVVKVIDGDTAWVERSGQVAIKVRLRYIDAPESCQAYGAESTAVLTALALGKVADLKITGRSYDRYVGTLSVGGSDVGTAMVDAGAAWVYRQATPKRSPLRMTEDMAHSARRGLWAEPNPVAPWLFRKTTQCRYQKAR